METKKEIEEELKKYGQCCLQRRNIDIDIVFGEIVCHRCGRVLSEEVALLVIE